LVIFASCGKAKEKKETNLAMVEEGEMAEKEKTEQKYVEGELLVKFKPEINAEERVKILTEEYGCEILDVIKGLDVYRIKIPKEKTVPEMVEILSKDERIKYAEPNYIYRLQL